MTIFLDLAKAFDIVDHSELLKTLPNFGVVSSSLDWFRSYLDNITQKIKIDGIIGNEMLINYGVLQDSVLGSIFFILYKDSISSLDIKGLIFTYADEMCQLFQETPRMKCV
ncbi:Reverse transcriptase domain [Cinara cedri]|uniref:Reverse transcriptase domain n=1 Tax=Cinara cedri TaxID=506608 RepID=A0A5E4MNN4_9HEMI|nr:Reverse transcriptase domain [Cinara cedri]